MSGALAIYEQSRRSDVAKLPPIQNRPGKPPKDGLGASFAGTGASVHVEVGPGRLVTLKDERKVVQFEVEFDRDVFVKSIEVAGPRIGRKVLEINAGVPGGVRKLLTLPQEYAVSPKPEPGDYTLTFRGTASAMPFSAASSSAVR
jgi:hypothetical protein